MPKGMILAAGRGTRLGPLTEFLPKPLVPVANLPVMAQGIQCLHRLGINTICANVSYHGQQIVDLFGDGHAYGVTMHWSQESEPTGTAGGMKGMQQILGDDTVVVIAGDAMLDVDLAPLLAAHHANGAFATLATIHVDQPSLYGVVVTDDAGRVVRFQEKPAPGTEISNQANTGIYIFNPGIFDLIPAGQFYDFAMNVFPEILQRGLPFYALPIQGYWTDIGNPGDYLQSNIDYLHGRIHVEGRGQKVNGSLIAQDAKVDGVQIHECVIGNNVTLMPGTVLNQCIVWPNTQLSEPVQLASAVLTPWGRYAIAGKEARPLASTISV